MIYWVVQNLLTLAIFLPLAGAASMLVVPARRDSAARYVAISFALAELLIACAVYAVAGGSAEFELVHRAAWIPSTMIFYSVGVDGASALLGLLTALVAPAAILASWNEIATRRRLFYALLLAVEAGAIGAFFAIDMFLFFVFWNMAILPACFIIGIWGSGDRMRIALKYMIFMMAGSAALLVAILATASVTGSFSVLDWYAHSFAPRLQVWLFIAFAFAFAIKVPAFGLHTWLPDAHSEAPTAGSMLLAAVMLKLGGYGFFRLAIPIFPQAVAWAAPFMLSLACVGVIGGALLAMVQTDIKRLIAYSSISQMGLVMLGLFSLDRYAAAGAIYAMAAHGLMVAMLFAVAGFMIERRGERAIAAYGGSARSLPMLSLLSILAVLAYLGLPGLAGFAGEFLILMGSFQTETAYAAVSVAGVVLTAGYMAWLVQRLYFGPLRFAEERKFPDLRGREYLCLLPIVILIVVAGIWPKPVLGRVWRPADAFVSLAKRGEIVVPAGQRLGALIEGSEVEAR